MCLTKSVSEFKSRSGGGEIKGCSTSFHAGLCGRDTVCCAGERNLPTKLRRIHASSFQVVLDA